METATQEQLEQLLRAMLMRTMGRRSADVELPCGESRGPYSIRELGAEPSEGENQITLLDQLGQAHHFEVESRDPLLRRIRGVADARLANCVITHTGDQIQLVVTKDVRPEDDLLAAFLPQHLPSTANEESEKKYPCSLCNNAKFSSRERLLAHQNLYCVKNAPSVALPQASSSIPQPSLLSTSPSPASLPSVILLPLAYHDQPQADLVQLLGPPQTFIPVAVGRTSVPFINPLLVQRNLCAAVTVPPAMLFSVGGIPHSLPVISVDSSPSSSSSSTASLLTKRAATGPSPPLDLSKRARFGSSPPAPLVKAGSSSEVEKPFICSCGIAFSAENTLKAHQQYYCKDVERQEEAREPQRKVPSRCSQCEFEPQSQSQLSVHVRNVHNDVQAYVCKVCGYRGFSLRGIRSHMRSHPTLDYLKFDALMATHVAQVKTEERTADDEPNNA